MESDGIVGVDSGGFHKLLRNLTFRISKYYAGLALSLGLSLHRHRILQRLWNQYILHLDRDDIDAPWLCALIDNLPQHAADLVPSFEHVAKHCLADHIAQSRLRCPIYRALVVGNIKSGLLGIEDLPEEHCIYIDGNRVFGERLLRLERTCEDAGIDPIGDGLHERNDPE